MRAPKVFVLATTLAALTIGLVPSGAAQKGGGKPPPPPPPSDKIAFVRTVGNDPWGKYQIFTMRSNGTEQIQLTVAGAEMTANWWPTWLPDGRLVYRRSKGDWRGQVCVMQSNGTGSSLLANVPACELHPGEQFTDDPADLYASPNGRFVALSNTTGVYIQRVDNPLPNPVLVASHTNSTGDANPGWDAVYANNFSPDLDQATEGYQGILLYSRSGNYLGITVKRLYAIGLGTSGAGDPFVTGTEQVVYDPGGNGCVKAVWSPDGTKIAMIGSGTYTGYAPLQTMEVPWTGAVGYGGLPVFPLTGAPVVVAVAPNTSGWFQLLNWSPDSKNLVSAFYFTSSGYLDVCKVTLPQYGGTGIPVRLTTNKNWEGQGSWSREIFP